MMIVLGIVAIWLVLTAAGYLALSALSQAGRREELQASRALHELQPSMLAKTRPAIPKVLLG
jgi:hypothetical protein